MKIKEFISIPKFIDKYINKNECGVENFTHDFCKIMMELEFECKPNGENSNIYLFDSKDNYSIKRFLEFYFNKSKLDYKFKCTYEDELNLSKSISNELFVVASIDDKIITMYIDSFDNGIIKMISV